jgi:hypothetical protein
MSHNSIRQIADVTPVAREQPPFARTIVLRYPTRVYQSDTTVVDQRPPRTELTPIKRKPPRHNRGGFHLPLDKRCLHISCLSVVVGVGRVHTTTSWRARR